MWRLPENPVSNDALRVGPYPLVRRAYWVLVVVAFVVRIYAIYAMPVMPDGDGYARLGRAGEFVIFGWLPGYQLIVNALAQITRDLLAFRVLTAAQGAIAALAVAALVGASRGQTAALAAGIVAAVSPCQVLPSTALYQEPLFVALAATGLLGVSENRHWGTLCLLCATWTRYEAWGLVLLCTAFYPRRSWPALLGPAVWLGWQGLSHPGIEVEVTPLRLVEQAHILRSLVPYWIGWPVVAIAVLGVVCGRMNRVEWVVLCFVAIDILGVALLRPFSPPDNARQLVVPSVGIALFVGKAASLAAGRSKSALGTVILAAGMRLPGVLGDLPSWQSVATDRARAAQGVLVAHTIRSSDRLLVLSPGADRTPGVEPDGCLFVAVWAGLPRDRVQCDTDSPEPIDLAWLQAEHIGHVVNLEPEAPQWLDHDRFVRVSSGVFERRRE